MENYGHEQFQVIQVHIGKMDQLWQTPGDTTYLE